MHMPTKTRRRLLGLAKFLAVILSSFAIGLGLFVVVSSRSDQIETKAAKAERTPVPSPSSDARSPAAAKSPVSTLRVVDMNTDFGVGPKKFRAELDAANKRKPDVIFLQETQWRDRILPGWARSNGYGVDWRADDAHQESVVLYAKDRFIDPKTSYRLGTGKTKRENGETLGARYIQTVQVTDAKSGQRLALISTHAYPEVWDWNDDKPRRDTEILKAFYGHIKRIRKQADTDTQDGYLTILGADLNSPFGKERDFNGFMTDVFDDTLVSNHTVLGKMATHTDANNANPRTIDYVYITPSTQMRFITETTEEIHSGHNMLIIDMTLTSHG
jgi:endonuclease/exonuclease/phosphatase (EEP) superfamily protein YafD